MAVSISLSAQVRESITVSYVEVPVTVVDRSGNPIRGLTSGNFEILDEGKKRPISGFEAVDFASREKLPMGSSPKLPGLTPAARRNFLLVFDLTFSRPSSIVRAQDAARQFVKKMAAEDDLIGVATIDVARGFRLLTSFTTDRHLIDAAIADPKNFKALDPLQIAGAAFDGEVVYTMNEPGKNPRTRGSAEATGTSIPDDDVRELNRQQDAYNRQDVEREVTLLAALSQVMRVVRGQKRIVLLSEGFDPRLVQGRDAATSQDKLAERDAVERGEVWKVENDDRYGSASSLSLVQQMADIAKRCDVVLDTVDIRGLRANVDPRNGAATVSNEGLHLLASATGGTVFKNTNDLADDLARVLKAQEVVYVLAFQAPVADPGTFHNLKVRLVDVPGGRAVARSGYYELGSGSEAERTLSDAEIIVNDVAQEGVHLASLAVPFGSRVPVVLEIDGHDLALANAPNVTLEIYTYAFDGDGSVFDSIFQRVTLDQSKVGAALRQSGVKYYATLSLPPGKYAVKSLVHVVETNKTGFVRTNVVVPRDGDLALSQPLFTDSASRWVMIRGASHDKDAAYPFVANDEFVPAVVARVKDGEPRRFVVFVRNAAPDELTVETHPGAKLVSKLRSEEGSTLVYELSGNPSVSMLNVTVKKRGSDGSRSASVPIVR
ncbi:MAG TPA: VWA domain-containing protein [Thermoanaerobaculia bacterium]|nr:VWA domain-containing protein [Thermoanaerobaculia bacterium]